MFSDLLLQLSLSGLNFVLLGFHLLVKLLFFESLLLLLESHFPEGEVGGVELGPQIVEFIVALEVVAVVELTAYFSLFLAGGVFCLMLRPNANIVRWRVVHNSNHIDRNVANQMGLST